VLAIRGGGPRRVKLGSRVLYDPNDLREWIESRKFASTAEYAEAGPRERATKGHSPPA
jgi:hypothetical protein